MFYVGTAPGAIPNRRDNNALVSSRLIACVNTTDDRLTK